MYSSPSSLQEQKKLSINPMVPWREEREGQRHTEREAEAYKNTQKSRFLQCCKRTVEPHTTFNNYRARYLPQELVETKSEQKEEWISDVHSSDRNKHDSKFISTSKLLKGVNIVSREDALLSSLCKYLCILLQNLIRSKVAQCISVKDFSTDKEKNQ